MPPLPWAAPLNGGALRAGRHNPSVTNIATVVAAARDGRNAWLMRQLANTDAQRGVLSELSSYESLAAEQGRACAELEEQLSHMHEELHKVRLLIVSARVLPRRAHARPGAAVCAV